MQQLKRFQNTLKKSMMASFKVFHVFPPKNYDLDFF